MICQRMHEIDPWGDESNFDLKERWLKFESVNTSSSTWTRKSEQQGGDTWSKPKDNWQNKGPMFNTKPQWQNNGVQNVGESRWLSQSNIERKALSNTWQSGKNTGSILADPEYDFSIATSFFYYSV